MVRAYNTRKNQQEAIMSTTGEQRRSTILEMLQNSSSPLSGASIGKQVGVTRQVVVQDIALLRNSGHDIQSTNRGYILITPEQKPTRLFKVRHTIEETETELHTIVDLGATVVDVIVNHRTYGRVEASLGLRNRRDVARFIADMQSGVSSPLMVVTSGYHFHHVSADSEEVLNEVESALAEAGFLVNYTPFEKNAF